MIFFYRTQFLNFTTINPVLSITNMFDASQRNDMKLNKATIYKLNFRLASYHMLYCLMIRLNKRFSRADRVFFF